MRSLSLDGCAISPGGARALAQGMKNGACVLQYFSVQGCQLGDIGVGYLECVWTEGAGPATLKISSNGIHDRGALHLSRIIASGTLRTCFADDNSISASGFAVIAAALCSAASRVQSLHVNSNNIGSEGASALFRYLGRQTPVVIQDAEIAPEDVFVTSRGSRVARELHDIQKEHLDDMQNSAADARCEVDRARKAFARCAAATATSHGKYRVDEEAYSGSGGYCDADGRLQWCWVERGEMRSNSIGSGCEAVLVDMLKSNSSLQVLSVLLCVFASS